MIYHFSAEDQEMGQCPAELAKKAARLLTIIPLAEGKGLSEIIAENLKSLSDVEAVIINRWQLPDDEESLQDALQMLMGIGFDAPVLLLVNDASVEETVQVKEGYTVLNRAHRDITEELALFIAGGQLKEDVKSTWIGIASARSGAGATTLAMQLAMLLASVEQRTCYIEADGSGQLEETAEWYGMETIEEGFRHRGAFFAVNAVNEDMLYNVIDFGCLTGRKAKLLNECQVKILVTDAKPYGLKHLKNILRLREDIQGRLDICLNFVPDNKEEQERILERLSGAEGDYRVHMNLLNPDFFSVTDNLPVLKRLVSGVADIAGTEKKKTQKLPGRLSLPDIGCIPEFFASNKTRLAAGAAACLMFIVLGICMRGILAKEPDDKAGADVLSASLAAAGMKQKAAGLPAPDTAEPAPVAEEPLAEPETVPEAAVPSEAPAPVTTEPPVTEAPFETPVEPPASEVTETATEAPPAETTAEVTTEEKKKTTTEEPPATEASIPDITKYDKDILSGKKVKSIIKKYGSYYSIIVETRNNGTGNYGLAGDSSKDIIDNKVSFYASLMYNGSEVTGLYLLQQ